MQRSHITTTVTTGTLSDAYDIKAVFLSRNEFEAICFGGDEATLVTDEPTELYTNYMERKKQELDEFMNK